MYNNALQQPVIKQVFQRMGAPFDGLRTLASQFAVAVGVRHVMALPKDFMLREVTKMLSEGKILPVQALGLLSANMSIHPESGSNQREFLKNSILLYNAKSIDDVCAADGILPESDQYKELQDKFSGLDVETYKAEIKILIETSLIRDITKPRRPTLFEKLRDIKVQFTSPELFRMKAVYQPNPNEGKQRVEVSEDGRNLMTFAGMDIKDILPILRKLKASREMNETQIGLMLCYILHAMERRKSGGGCYVDHPMGVANMVIRHGQEFFQSEEMTWKATLVALLHDCGEHNENFNILRDLAGLLPADVVEAVDLLHKKEGQSYFEFIKAVGRNKLSAFVKICDICHNTDGAEKTITKQKYVYSLAADYLIEVLSNPHKAGIVTVGGYAVNNVGYSVTEFSRIDMMSKKGSKDTGHALNPKLSFVSEEIFKSLMQRIQANAHPRREEDITLQL